MKITKTQLMKIIKEELAEYSRPGREPGGPGKEVSTGTPKEWWNATGEARIKVIRDIYKRRGQIPPEGEQARADVWKKLIKDREDAMVPQDIE